MPGWPGRSRHLRGRWRMKWPAAGQLPGRDPNGGYARRRLGGSASDVGSIPTASTIAGPSAKPVPNGRFAEGLCFARVLRGFRGVSASAAPDAYCEIFFVGANGGWNNDVAKLIGQIRAMVGRRGEERPYLVIVPYWSGFSQEKKDAFKTAFGRRAVEFPVEASLCFRNSLNVHLNEQGYALLAKLLHTRGAELGYWPPQRSN